MFTTMTLRTLPRAARAATLAAILAAGTGACEHTGSLEPLSPRTAPAASVESREMETLLTAVQREMGAQGSADAAREQLITALLAAAREPVPHGTSADRPTAVPAHIEQALSRLMSAQGDSTAIMSILHELVERGSPTP